MSMNIKSNEAHALAVELARLRGTTVTQAVTEALRSELERERARSRKTGLADELIRIGKHCAAHVTRPVSSQDHGAMLYDEQGLPR
jgi:antitoxin VapB